MCSGTNCTNVRETNPGLFFFLCLRSEAEDEKIMIYGKEVKSVDAFCYLGSLMAADSNCDREIKVRLKKAGLVKPKVFKKKCLSF